ncbi:MAG: DUF2892 domain-containing protein [Candidatus Eremiobacteraeota bacterium]|nr:DUF2892 domain-containing protein [Candidatus Eremiobacteraeota bacterium]
MRNIGPLDRFLRGLVGAGLTALALNGEDWGWFGLSVWTTALLEVCPFYALLRISTR